MTLARTSSYHMTAVNNQCCDMQTLFPNLQSHEMQYTVINSLNVSPVPLLVWQVCEAMLACSSYLRKGQGTTPVSGGFKVGQLTLQRSDLVLLLSECTAQHLNLACPA